MKHIKHILESNSKRKISPADVKSIRQYMFYCFEELIDDDDMIQFYWSNSLPACKVLVKKKSKKGYSISKENFIKELEDETELNSNILVAINRYIDEYPKCRVSVDITNPPGEIFMLIRFEYLFGF